MTDNNQIKSDIVDGVNDAPIIIKSVPVLYKSRWNKLLANIRLLPRKRRIVLSGATPSTIFRIALITNDLKLPKGEIASEDYQRAMFTIIRDNYGTVMDFLATALHNRGSERPPEWLFTSLGRDFSMEELLDLTTDIYRRLDVVPFFGIINSIVQVKLQVSHTLESTVPGPSSATSASTTDGRKISSRTN